MDGYITEIGYISPKLFSLQLIKKNTIFSAFECLRVNCFVCNLLLQLKIYSFSIIYLY